MSDALLVVGVLGSQPPSLSIVGAMGDPLQDMVISERAIPLDLQIIGSRFRDAPDGRRQIGGSPAGGGV
jgi:hypothetical protein